MVIVSAVILILAIGVASRAVIARLDTIAAHLRVLREEANPVHPQSAIDAMKELVERTAKELEQAVSDFDEKKLDSGGDRWAACQRWHAVQRADMLLLHRQQVLQQMLFANAAVRGGLKTIPEIQADASALAARQNDEHDDRLREGNIYDLLELEGVVKLSKLKNGHKLLLICETCNTRTSTTAGEMFRTAVRCGECHSDLSASAPLSIHPVQTTRLGHVLVERDVVAATDGE